MARIAFPNQGNGEHVDWALLRPDMAKGMGPLSEAVYVHSRLALREREAARWVIATINDCKVCKSSRAIEGEAQGIGEPYYQEVSDWRRSAELSVREKLAAEFAERFSIDHLAMDEEFWIRLRASFSDDEIVDLTICCGMWLGLGRMLAVMGIRAPEETLLV
jgi:alkylhydroperoxidase family enzyme